jgi:hypothetical protein
MDPRLTFELQQTLVFPAAIRVDSLSAGSQAWFCGTGFASIDFRDSNARFW